MTDLDQRRHGVLIRAVQAVTEALWQARGMPLDGMEELRDEARLAADHRPGRVRWRGRAVGRLCRAAGRGGQGQ